MFSVGDKVILRKPKDTDKWWLPPMDSLDGSIVTLKLIDIDGTVKFKEKAADGRDYWYLIDWIEPICEEETCNTCFDVDMNVLFST